MYTSLDDLPNNVRQRVIAVGEIDPRAWVLQAIPALDNKSIVEVMNEQDGLVQVLRFLQQVIGHFS
jgi:hypothetical protein